MHKRKEQNLRRQIEILKAQVKSREGIYISTKATESEAPILTKQPQAKQTFNDLDIPTIKSELKKTLIFSVFIVGALLTLYLTYSKWIAYIKFI